MEPTNIYTDRVISKLTRIETTRACGMHPWEKHPERKNRLIISVEMHAELPKGALAGSVFIDYDTVHSHILEFPTLSHTETLEEIADELCHVCFSIQAVAACRITIEKPDIFHDADAAGIDVFRTRSGFLSQ